MKASVESWQNKKPITDERRCEERERSSVCLFWLSEWGIMGLWSWRVRGQEVECFEIFLEFASISFGFICRFLAIGHQKIEEREKRA